LILGGDADPGIADRHTPQPIRRVAPPRLRSGRHPESGPMKVRTAQADRWSTAEYGVRTYAQLRNTMGAAACQRA